MGRSLVRSVSVILVVCGFVAGAVVLIPSLFAGTVCGCSGSGNEVAVSLENGTITEETPETVSMTVLDEDENPVSNATVVVTAGTATLSEPVSETAGSDGTVTIDRLAASLPEDRELGTLEIDVVTDADATYVDEYPNPQLYVTSDDRSNGENASTGDRPEDDEPRVTDDRSDDEADTAAGGRSDADGNASADSAST